jgi:hypothetical protein
MPVTQTGLLSQVNMAVVRQCAATFIELVKKVPFVNEFRTAKEHPLGKGEVHSSILCGSTIFRNHIQALRRTHSLLDWKQTHREVAPLSTTEIDPN